MSDPRTPAMPFPQAARLALADTQLRRNLRHATRLFRRTLPGAPEDVSDDPGELAEAARLHLRRLFPEAKVGISGANFASHERERWRWWSPRATGACARRSRRC